MKPNRNETLLAAFGEIRDEYVLEAAPEGTAAPPAPAAPHAGGQNAKPRAKRLWLRWGALAACAALVIWAGVRLPGGGLSAATTGAADSEAAAAEAAPELAAAPDALAEDSTEDSEPLLGCALPQDAAPADAGSAKIAANDEAADEEAAGLAAAVGTAEDLPLISLPEGAAGYGYEGVLEYEPAGLENGNPWAAAEAEAQAALTTLPVYTNTACNPVVGQAGPPVGLSESELRAAADSAAAALGAAVTETTVETIGQLTPAQELPTDTVCRLTAQTDSEWVLEVDSAGTVTAWYGSAGAAGEGLALPDGYSLAYNLTDLLEQFAALVDFTRAEPAVFTDYTFGGTPHSGYYAYDAAGTLAEQIEQFSLEKAQFACNDAGRLMLIRRYHGLTCAEELGDYPLLTAAEAESLLQAGYYASSVPVSFADTEGIARVELCYREGEAVLLPYYKFWALLPDAETPEDSLALGLHTYGAYYVPAVQPAYLTALPTYDGSFN